MIDKTVAYGILAILLLTVASITTNIFQPDLTGLASGNLVRTCFDSDGGKNYSVQGYTKGTTTRINYELWDNCQDSTYLMEQYCYKDLRGTKKFACPSGTACQAGACVKITNFCNGLCEPGDSITCPTDCAVQPPPPVCGNGICESNEVTTCPGDCVTQESCFDSDGGNNPGISGTLTVVNATGTFSFNDYCGLNNVVTEQYCSGNKAMTGIIECPVGQTCSNGACIIDQNGNSTNVTVYPANEKVITSFDFETGSGTTPPSWTTVAYILSQAKFKWESTFGHSGQRSLNINLSSPNDARWVYKIKLEPQRSYRLAGYIKGENIVTNNRGTTGANLNANDWDRSQDITGTFGWTNVSFIFQGATNTEIKCRLGFYSNTVTGTAWCDDLVLTSDPLTAYAGTHIHFFLEPQELASITDANMKQWVSNLDQVYNAYVDLVGGSPFNGQSIGIMSVARYPGGWAVSGNPIQWFNIYINEELARVNTGDWSFGIMHEISHDFDLGGGIWNFDAEFWANTKMYYAVEMLNAKVNMGKDYTGSELKNYYKTDAGASWDKTLALGVFSGDGLTYKFIQIRDQIGWDSYKQTFRYFQSLSPSQVPTTRLGKFNLFLDKLTEYSGFDVRTLFTQTEMDAITTEYSK
ncbi:MAG: M60 family metallopeptidase [Nanoarchaeota archaeon]